MGKWENGKSASNVRNWNQKSEWKSLTTSVGSIYSIHLILPVGKVSWSKPIPADPSRSQPSSHSVYQPKGLNIYWEFVVGWRPLDWSLGRLGQVKSRSLADVNQTLFDSFAIKKTSRQFSFVLIFILTGRSIRVILPLFFVFSWLLVANRTPSSIDYWPLAIDDYLRPTAAAKSPSKLIFFFVFFYNDFYNRIIVIRFEFLARIDGF